MRRFFGFVRLATFELAPGRPRLLEELALELFLRELLLYRLRRGWASCGHRRGQTDLSFSLRELQHPRLDLSLFLLLVRLQHGRALLHLLV
jgi:hypothetical protein